MHILLIIYMIQCLIHANTISCLFAKQRPLFTPDKAGKSTSQSKSERSEGVQSDWSVGNQDSPETTTIFQLTAEMFSSRRLVSLDWEALFRHQSGNHWTLNLAGSATQGNVYSCHFLHILLLKSRLIESNSIYPPLGASQEAYSRNSIISYLHIFDNFFFSFVDRRRNISILARCLTSDLVCTHVTFTYWLNQEH